MKRPTDDQLFAIVSCGAFIALFGAMSVIILRMPSQWMMVPAVLILVCGCVVACRDFLIRKD